MNFEEGDFHDNIWVIFIVKENILKTCIKLLDASIFTHMNFTMIQKNDQIFKSVLRKIFSPDRRKIVFYYLSLKVLNGRYS